MTDLATCHISPPQGSLLQPFPDPNYTSFFVFLVFFFSSVLSVVFPPSPLSIFMKDWIIVAWEAILFSSDISRMGHWILWNLRLIHLLEVWVPKRQSKNIRSENLVQKFFLSWSSAWWIEIGLLWHSRSTLTLITPPSPTNVEAGRPFTDLVFLLKYLHTIVLMVYREKVKLALFAVSYN